VLVNNHLTLTLALNTNNGKHLLTLIISIVVLIFTSAYFSAAETGLTALSRARIHKLKISGNKRAAIVTKIRIDKEKLIGTLLLGNNAVNILASSVATSAAIGYLGEEKGVIFSSVAMTVIVLVFAEVLPKTYAFYHAEKVALRVAPSLLLLIKLFTPFTKLIEIIVNFLMWVMRVKNKSENILSPIDELRGAIELHHHEGKVVKRDKDMLRGILDLSETEVEDVMVHRKNIYSIDINQPTADIITNVLDSRFTRIPLWKDKPDNIVGVLHAKALLKALRSYAGDVDDLKIMDIAIKPWFVPETNTLSNQLYQFREKRNHMALVVDEYGALVGLVTLEDILEEIVGHIDDEHNNGSLGIKKLKDSSYRIKGDNTLRDINRHLDWHLPDDGATTIAGLIINESERIPAVGEEFIYHGFWFKVDKKKNNQITSVLVKKIGKAEKSI
jgi:Mg2+/Co2+ transporter CorB